MRSLLRLPLQLGAWLRALWFLAGAAIPGGCASGPPPTPELARFDPQQGYRFAQTARGADNTISLLVALTVSGGGTRAASLARGILDEPGGIDIESEGWRRRLPEEVLDAPDGRGGAPRVARLGATWRDVARKNPLAILLRLDEGFGISNGRL